MTKQTLEPEKLQPRIDYELIPGLQRPDHAEEDSKSAWSKKASHKAGDLKTKPKGGKQKKRPKQKFDATCGYPGEGPPKKAHGPKICYNCRKPGHQAKECKQAVRKKKPKLVVEPDPVAALGDLKKLVGPADVIIEIAEEAEGKHGEPLAPADDPPPDDPPPAGGGPGGLPDAGPALGGRPPPLTPAEKREAIVKDLRAKCTTMLWTKDLSCEADLNVVKRALVAIARSASMHEVDDDVIGTCSEVFHFGYGRVCAVRLAEEQDRLEHGHIDFVSLVEKGVDRPPPSYEEWTQTKRHGGQKSYGICCWRRRINVGGQARSEVLKELKTKKPGDFAMPMTGVQLRHMMYLTMWRNLQMVFIAVLAEELLRLAICVPITWLVEEHHAHVLAVTFCCTVALYETVVRWRVDPWPWLIVGLFVRVTLHLALGELVRCSTNIFSWLLLFILHVMFNFTMISTGFGAWQLSIFNADHLHLWQYTPVFADTCCGDHPLKLAPIQAAAEVQWGEPVCVPSFGARMFWGVRHVIATVFRKCIHNEMFSWCGRVGKELPLHKSPEQTAAVIKRWKATRPTVQDMQRLVRKVKVPLNYVQWCNSFPPAKREMFLRLERDGGMEILGNPVASAFIKRELALKATYDLKFKDPRWIQGCPVALSALTGRWLRRLAKNLRNGLRPRAYSQFEIEAGKQIVYTCGMSSNDIGKAYFDSLALMESVKRPGERVVVFEDDQSRFDLHLTEGPMGCLDSFYQTMVPERIRRLLKRGKASRGRSGLGTKYKIPFTMQSGWPDTSIGDTALNAVMKYEIHGRGRRWISIICGDDSVTITLDSELERLGGCDGIVKLYAEFGMEVEAQLRPDPKDAEFCSGRFLFLDDTCVLVPKVGKAVGRFGWDMVDRKPGEQREWLKSIATTCEQLGKLDPIMRSLAIGIRAHVGEGSGLTLPHNEYKHTFTGSGPASLDNIYDYYSRFYGLSCGDVSAICQRLESLQLHEWIDDPLVEALVLVDV